MKIDTPKAKTLFWNFICNTKSEFIKKLISGLRIYLTFLFSIVMKISLLQQRAFARVTNSKARTWRIMKTISQSLLLKSNKIIRRKLSPSEMIHLDNNIVQWVKETYRQYGVNLFSFAYDLADTYYNRYVKYERERFGERPYYVNNYNHRYNHNPFDIDRIYEDNRHRPFLENKRGELEMLVMHEWLFTMVYDDDYWPEYVNLCVSRGRVNIVRNVNPLIPVTSAGLKYPEDAPCVTEHIITTDGILKKAPEGAYILRIDASQMYAGVWQNSEEMMALITALNASFKEFGVPKVLELTAPIKTTAFDEEVFSFMLLYTGKENEKAFSDESCHRERDRDPEVEAEAQHRSAI